MDNNLIINEISDEKKLNLKFAKMILAAYTTGHFEPLFPFMTDDYKHESYWVKEPMIGKDTVIEYYVGKGASMRSGDLPKGCLVRIGDKPKTITCSDVSISGKRSSGMTKIIVLGERRKICVLFEQVVDDGEIIHTLAIPTVTQDGMIKSILITEPRLFNLEPYMDPDVLN